MKSFSPQLLNRTIYENNYIFSLGDHRITDSSMDSNDMRTHGLGFFYYVRDNYMDSGPDHGLRKI